MSQKRITLRLCSATYAQCPISPGQIFKMLNELKGLPKITKMLIVQESHDVRKPLINAAINAALREFITPIGEFIEKSTQTQSSESSQSIETAQLPGKLGKHLHVYIEFKDQRFDKPNKTETMKYFDITYDGKTYHARIGRLQHPKPFIEYLLKTFKGQQLSEIDPQQIAYSPDMVDLLEAALNGTLTVPKNTTSRDDQMADQVEAYLQQDDRTAAFDVLRKRTVWKPLRMRVK